MFNFHCFSLGKKRVPMILAAGLCLAFALSLIFTYSNQSFVNSDSSYIKWVEFNIPYSVLRKAIELDIRSQREDVKLDFIELLAYLSSKNGGNYKNHKDEALNSLVKRLKDGERMQDITEGVKLYPYYIEAYSAILSEYVGEYETDSGARYGVKVRHPVKGSYTESDDFGNARNYGFKRVHLGHDFMAGIGTTVCAMEGGVVEALGWNQYGGWRIGIRSFDGKRYYYYAHLRKDNPYAKDLAEGQTVKAGQTIGYVGRTGYSTKENVNNIETPHLHFGIQLIFDESQKEGVNQIWIDCYQISKLLKNPPQSVALN